MKVTLVTLKMNYDKKAYESVAKTELTFSGQFDAERFVKSMCYRQDENQVWTKRIVTRQGDYRLEALLKGA